MATRSRSATCARSAMSASALCIAPAIKGADVASLLSTHPPLEQAPRAARADPGRARAGRRKRSAGPEVGFWDAVRGRGQREPSREPGCALRRAQCRDRTADRAGPCATGDGLSTFCKRPSAAVLHQQDAAESCSSWCDGDRRAPDVRVDHGQLRLHLGRDRRELPRRPRRDRGTVHQPARQSTPALEAQGFGTGAAVYSP